MKLFAKVLALALAIPLGAAAQADYPSRSIRMIVAYPPGGSTDVTARLVADRLSQAVGQPVVVENKAGASGTIGAAMAAQAAPDGYTLFFGSAAELSIAPVTRRNVPYEPLRDFQPITQVGQVPFLLVTNPEVPANNLKELIAWIKSRPGRVNYSSFGNNTTNHLVGEAFKLAADVQAAHVPYKGSAPSITDLIGGQVQYTFDTITATLPHVRNGRLKAIAVSTKERSRQVPDVPTLSESGLPGFVGATWSSVLVPAGTPQAIVRKLHAELVKIIRSDEIAKEFSARGIEPVGSTPEEFARFISAEIDRWTALAKRIDLKVE